MHRVALDEARLMEAFNNRTGAGSSAGNAVKEAVREVLKGPFSAALIDKDVNDQYDLLLAHIANAVDRLTAQAAGHDI